MQKEKIYFIGLIVTLSIFSAYAEEEVPFFNDEGFLTKNAVGRRIRPTQKQPPMQVEPTTEITPIDIEEEMLPEPTTQPLATAPNFPYDRPRRSLQLILPEEKTKSVEPVKEPEELDTDMESASGMIILDKTTATNFSLDNTNNIVLIIGNGSHIYQKSNNQIRFDFHDFISIVGENNSIHLTDNLIINCPVLFNYGSNITFVFDTTGLTLTFAVGSLENWNKQSSIIISGSGTIKYGDKTVQNVEELFALVHSE